MDNENINYEDETVISLGDMWRHFIDHIIIVAAIAIILTGCGFVAAKAKGVTYQTSGTLTVNNVNIKDKVMESLINDDVLTLVSTEIDVKKESIENAFSVSSQKDSTTITVTYSSKNNANVKELLNSFLSNSIIYLNEKDGDAYLRPQIANTTTIDKEATSVAALSSVKKLTAVGLLLGLLVGGIFVVVITVKDDRFRDRKEVETLNIPLLGEVKGYAIKKEVK